MKQLRHNQHGFGIGALILAILVMGLVYGGFKFVQMSNASNAEQARKLTETLQGEKEVERDTELVDGEQVAKETRMTTEVAIEDVEVVVAPITITIKLMLPAQYTGRCIAEIQQPGGAEYKRFVSEFKNQKTCEIYIPAVRLSSAKTWEYEAKFYSEDGSVLGTFPKGTLTTL